MKNSKNYSLKLLKSIKLIPLNISRIFNEDTQLVPVVAVFSQTSHIIKLDHYLH